ncbi:hypothetical protein CLF_105425 [Clonorchis sinensis]|uniref:Uncharacterized protein n=1 Tax=Clonorchis sinensis TaxID=79923 RepID=G7YDI1_CLOSI|nr:hypothetical protein CLF_105425 [Clonorchis sinensis]
MNASRYDEDGLKFLISNATVLRMDGNAAQQWPLDRQILLRDEKCVRKTFGGDLAKEFVVHGGNGPDDISRTAGNEYDGTRKFPKRQVVKSLRKNRALVNNESSEVELPEAAVPYTNWYGRLALGNQRSVER